MRFPKLKWTLLAGAILGVLVPIVLLLVTKYGHFLLGGTIDLCLWPTGVMLMATENHDHDLFALSILAYSILLNVLYYLLIATLLWCIVRFLAVAMSWIRTR